MLLNHSEAKAGRLHVGDTVVTPVAGFTSFGWGGSRGALGADYARPVRIAIISQGRQLTAPIRDIEAWVRAGALSVSLLALIIRRIRR